jgi:hypothetical protein
VIDGDHADEKKTRKSFPAVALPDRTNRGVSDDYGVDGIGGR